MSQHTTNYDLSNWATDEIIKKYLEAGGDPSKMKNREVICYFFDGLCYREGEQAVRDYVDNYRYKNSPTYYRGYA